MSELWRDPVFGPVASELYRRCGLVFEGGQSHLFRRRVERRAEDLGYPSAAAYVSGLAARGDAELDLLVELLTVNETYFFREEEHFHAVVGELWPSWARGGHGPIRVWSAGSSIGCEAYTLAILLREKGLVGAGRPAPEILATDINRRVLEEAQAALYGEFSLRNTSAYFRSKYFRPEGQQVRLVPEVASMVTFRKLNLLTLEGSMPAGGFHVIFCRNVLIYFDVAAKRRTIEALVKALRPGGVLIVGRSESLFNVPEAPPLVNLGGTLLYRKP
ncbi:MAG: protein-glutamate O-methyltransferase CheR [Deltaproteobacteria bacterium]|nr:protein-glutamate O-methyltransferase CheR [Deltaproteobacteria bacterium]